jgi:hypothetical protein
LMRPLIGRREEGACDLKPHPEERALARVSKDGRESRCCPSFETRAKRPAPQDEGAA